MTMDGRPIARVGRPKKKGSDSDPITLAEAGIDKHLADKARKMVRLSEAEFEAHIAGIREKILNRGRGEKTVNPNSSRNKRIRRIEGALRALAALSQEEFELVISTARRRRKTA